MGLGPLERDEILEFLQDKADVGCGQPVQKVKTRIRSFQGGQSVYIDMQNSSIILADMADEAALEAQFSIGTSAFENM